MKSLVTRKDKEGLTLEPLVESLLLVVRPGAPSSGQRKTFLAKQKVKSKTGSLEDRLIF